MYLVAALYFILVVMLNGFASGAPPFTPVELSNKGVALFAAFSILNLLITMYADTLYWRHTNRLIRRARFADPRDQIAWLRRKGGSSSIWLVVLVVVYLFSLELQVV